MLGGRRVGVSRSLSLAKRARIAYEPYGVVGVIGAGSAPFAQPLGQIAGALLAGNGVVFKPAARACLAGERILRVLTRAGLPEGLVRIVHGGPDTGIAAGRVERREDPLHRLAGGRPSRRPRLRLAREGGHRRARRQGRDAGARRRAPAACRRGRAVGRLRRSGAGAGLARADLRRARALRAVPRRARARRFADAGRRPRRRAHAGRARWPRRPACDGCRSWSARRWRRERRCIAAARSSRAGAYYAPAVLSGVPAGTRLAREPVDGPVVAVYAVDSEDEAIARANDSDYSLGASVWTADRYRGARIARELQAGMVWLNDHLPGADGLARPVGRRRRRRHRAHARRGRAARLRAGEADHVGPAPHARHLVVALRRDDRAGGRRRRARCAPSARPTASARGAPGCVPLARLLARAFGRGLPQ